ncbi:4-hydroxy-tetrahydrodipicolinate reductase [Euzebya tangerina]|uniref:4-hydroxy-tetrahydrodipicolinate reductase n=1 Tax=Euzebya tangerina TaxID=591198 RepID=UPI000E31DE57|nr:4-hydroxy-tetrahydrodipicolinate reductase [Euzebya tangerina]
MLRVAVLGALGRMGQTTCAAIDGDPDVELVAALDADDSREKLLDAGADVCVDFTHPDSVKANVLWLLRAGVHAVVGTTGLTDEDLAEIDQATGPANALVAPNFAVGAVLLMRFAEEAAVHLPNVEIIELHHDRKADAPSGTALRTAKLIAEAQRSAPPGTAAAGGTPAPVGPDDNPARGLLEKKIPVHSVRLPGLVAHQQVMFGGTGETLTLTHDSLDRSSFMPGVLLAVKAVGTRPGLTVGLEHILFD